MFDYKGWLSLCTTERTVETTQAEHKPLNSCAAYKDEAILLTFQQKV